MEHLKILKQDKKLAMVLDVVTPYQPVPNKDIYLRLMRAVAGQQLSVKAASTIWNRFLNLFPDQYPEANSITSLSDETMRAAGLSYQKARYMKNIASFSQANDISYAYLASLSDEAVVTYLSGIKGVGKWTVQMLLMFSLERKDVFPVDDLGILNAMKKLYRLKQEGKDLKAKCLKIAERWRPHRSHACFYLWPYKDFKPE